MSRPRISLLAADCTAHTLPRPRILAPLLAGTYEVEVVAPVFPGDRDAYAAASWPGRYTPVPVCRLPGFVRAMGDLIDALTGDVIYACKARMTSYGVALLARRRRKMPVVVDLDDRDIYQCYPYSHHASKNLVLSYPEWANPNAYPLTLAMEKLVKRADQVTSVSSFFQRLFGGAIVPQAVDTALFNPGAFDRKQLRRAWGLDGYRVVMFLGRPLPHKGLEEIVSAVERSRHPDVRLVVQGPYTPYVESLRKKERVIILPTEPYEKGPAFLAMADVVMVPQRVSPISLGQMPTKIPEAMAMGVPVIATAISDIPEQVGGGGLVIPPGDIDALTEALERVLGDDSLASSLGAAGRQRALELYSIEAVRPTMEEVFAPFHGISYE